MRAVGSRVSRPPAAGRSNVIPARHVSAHDARTELSANGQVCGSASEERPSSVTDAGAEAAADTGAETGVNTGAEAGVNTGAGGGYWS